MSRYTMHLARLWGAKEGSAKLRPDSEIIGEGQEAFEAKFNTLAYVAGARYFLLEFAATREHLAADITADIERHRQHFYKQLQEDPRCRQLGLAGHYAAYLDHTNALAFEPYPLAATPDVAARPVRWPAIDPPAFPGEDPRASVAFEGFHGYVTKMGEGLSEESPGLYERGYGLPFESFIEYVNVLHKYLWEGVAGGGEALFAVYEPKHKVFTMFPGTVEGLVGSINEACLARAYQRQLDDGDVDVC